MHPKRIKLSDPEGPQGGLADVKSIAPGHCAPAASSFKNMHIFMLRPEHIPEDIITPILEQLLNRRDLGHCALVNKAFNRAATPLLYSTLDSRVRISANGRHGSVIHPSKTLLRKPQYTRYVHHVRETATVGLYDPEIMPDCRRALKLCKNLRSFTWADDSTQNQSTGSDADLLAYLDIVQDLGIKEITIRTSASIGEDVWNKLTQLTGLFKVGIWCLHGKPRVLQGWSEKLGNSLTHLELGRCAGVPATILISVLSQLPLLKALRLKGAPSNSIPEILTLLPHLEELDTEYFGSSSILRYNDEPLASLRVLTVRASSVDILGPQQLWSWIRRLVPRPSLETLTLNTFSTQGDFEMPRMFLLDLAETHKHTLKHINMDAVQLTLDDLQCCCASFPELETIACSIVWCRDMEEIGNVISNALKLRQIKLSVNWLRETNSFAFDVQQARKWMMRENVRLRIIGLGSSLYTGIWVQNRLEDGTADLEFKVLHDRLQDTWI